jgi:hypothetical protein
VITHRDPVAVIPSMGSLMVALRGGTSRPGVDPVAIDARALARREMEQWKVAVDRYEEVKARRPERFHDVWQRDLFRDPLAVDRGIYDRFDRELMPEAEKHMGVWATARRASAPGKHRYSLQDFGLDEDEIKEFYPGYRERYGFVVREESR